MNLRPAFFWEKLMELHNSDERRPSLLASSYEDDSEVSNSRECKTLVQINQRSGTLN